MFLRILIVILVVCGFLTPTADAIWVWTPETNKFVNPKYSLKDTPTEQLEVAKKFFDLKDYSIAIREFKKLIKHYPKSREAAEAQYFIGMSQEELGNYFEGFKAYQLVIDQYPFSERASEIVERQFNMAVDVMEGKYKKNKFIKVVSGGDLQVVEILRQVIKNAPYGKFAAEAQYKIGLYLKEKRLYQEARDEFEKTINDYPNTDWSKAAQYQIALTDAKRVNNVQRDQQITTTAVNEFKEFIDQHPDAELSDEAKDHVKQLREKEAENNFIVAQFYEKQKNYKAAKIYYNTVVDEYNDTVWSPKALEKIQQLGKNL